MQCPVDGETLLITERQSVEIDYCPKCRGVWLDRGELDKLIRREDDEFRAYAPRPDYDRDHERRPDYDPRYDKRYPKKKKRWLDDIFDFD